MSKQLIERLRGFKDTPRTADNLCHEAADRIEELEREVAELTGANVLNRNALRLQKEKTDQLREQVKMLRDAIEYSGAAKSCQGLADALAATEPKP